MKILKAFIREGRSDCPECGNKNTFSVTKEGTELLYHCFHVNCGIKGKIKNDLSLDYIRSYVDVSINSNSVFSTPNIRDRSSSRLDCSFVGINADCINYLSTYSISSRYFSDLKYDPKQHRLVFPLRNHEGELHGYVGRRLSNSNGAKWYFYWRDMGCPYIRNTMDVMDRCIVVEDCISCLRCSSICNSVAVLGTSITQNCIQYLNKYKHLWIALDPDALHKSVKIAKYLNYFVPTDILPITKDLKYYSDEELEKIRKRISE